MSKLKVIALVCPDCGRSLVGMRYDRIFFCMSCNQGLFSRDEGWERYPLHFAALEEHSVKPALYLPVWKLEIAIEAAPVNDQQEEALKKVREKIKSAWVTGFTVLRPSYYGDLGLIYTESGIELNELETVPAGVYVAGCTRAVEDASRYAELFVTLILDKKADVTGMDISMETQAASLWAIPFADSGDKIMDLVTGNSMPVFAVDDLEDIRRISRKR